MNSPLTMDLPSFCGTGSDCEVAFCFRSFLRLRFFDPVYLLVDRSRFLGLGEALEYCECFIGPAVVLCESRGVLVVECCDEGSEEDNRVS